MTGEELSKAMQAGRRQGMVEEAKKKVGTRTDYVEILDFEIRTVLRSTRKYPNNRIYLKCRCKCGNEIWALNTKVFSKKKPLRGCGCDQSSYRKFVDLKGKVYGNWQVQEFAGWERRRQDCQQSLWKCKCIYCGKEEVKNQGALYKISTVRVSPLCTCKRNARIEEGRKETHLPALRSLFKSCMQGAKKRNLPFDISEEFAFKLFKSACDYCGCQPEQVHRYNKHTVLYNGIDRVNNEVGYFETNCAPACGDCNIAKRSRSKAEYEAWILRSAEHIKAHSTNANSDAILLRQTVQEGANVGY